MSDITLPQSIEQEGGNFIQLVTTRYKIVALTCVDTFNIVRQASSWLGPLKPKRKQRIHNEKYDLPGIINDRPFIQLLVGKKGSRKSVLCCKYYYSLHIVFVLTEFFS